MKYIISCKLGSERKRERERENSRSDFLPAKSWQRNHIRLRE